MEFDKMDWFISSLNSAADILRNNGEKSMDLVKKARTTPLGNSKMDDRIEIVLLAAE